MVEKYLMRALFSVISSLILLQMLRKIQRFIDENHLLHADNRPVIVGVSGGSDSVVLLHVLHKLGYSCIIAHCNFHLRMDESNRDEKFVRSLSEVQGLSIHTIDFETFEYAKSNGISIEMAARELRYSWFEKLLKQNNAQAIAVGHHLDDNAETFLINLTRGTGLKGLTGIPVRTGNIIRPLLATSRNDIKQYIDDNKLEFVEDSTNFSTDFIRNKIRHQLIPLLEELNPGFSRSLDQTRKNLGGAYNIFQETINHIRSIIVTVVGNKTEINILQLKTYNQQSTILYEILKEFHFHPDQTQQIIESIDANAGKMFYSSSHILLKDRGSLIIQSIEDISLKNDGNQLNQTKSDLRFCTFEKSDDFEYSKSLKTIHLDADKISFPMKQRYWKAADYFYPLGMKQKKKLSDFLIDKKVDRFEKQKVKVLISDEQIVWVIGFRMDDRFKVTDETQNILEVSF